MVYFILERLKKEMKLSPSQFGGIKGSSIDHFLIETWDCALQVLKDGRAAATLASIDFEKAFNRVCHYECLKSAKEMGATTATLGLVKAFLTGRQMSVKVNGVMSGLKSVDGGFPQGSLLGALFSASPQTS